MNFRKPTRAFLLAAVVGAVAMGACSLNPQPIPPGAQAEADGGADNFGNGGGSDASVATPTDSGVAGTPPEAGDDAGDAAPDASDLDASDADTDANDE
jgi:hypothetical protein